MSRFLVPALDVGGGDNGTPFSLDYFGEEITFVGTGQTGQYADGSYWVSGSLTGMSPAFATGVNRTLEDLSVQENTEVHGWMVDPGNAERYKTGDLSTLALRQAANYGVGAGVTNQAYDSLIISTNHAYDAANKQALPITSGSVVKAKSQLTGINNSGRPVLDYKGVLTLVSSTPASGSIRPPIARASKAPVLNTSDIDLTKLRNLDVSGFSASLPAYQTLLDWLSGTHTWQHSRNVNSRNILPLNGLGLDPYFGTTARQWSEVLLALHTNHLSSEQKTNLVIQIGKIAGDIAAAVYEGRVFTPNGGHSIGRLPILAFAAEVFDNSYLRDACNVTMQATIANETAVGYSVFGDLGQLYYITQAMIDESVGELYPFPQEALGYPAWGSQFAIDPANNVSGNILGNTLGGTDNTGITNAASYGQIVGKSFAGASLAIRLLQNATPSVPLLYHDYADRYIGYELNGDYVFTGEDPPTVPDAAHATPAWVKEAYTEFSPLVDTWPSGPLTARQSILFPSRNGVTQGVRLEAPQLSNWMQASSARQAGAMMLDVLVQNDASIENASTVRATKIVAGIGTAATNGIWTLIYNSSNNTAGQEKRLQLYCRTNEMSAAGDPAMIAFGPSIRDGEQGTVFMLFSDTEMSLAMAWADGTVSTGTPVSMPASFIGRTSPGTMVFGGSKNASASFVNFFGGCLGRFAYLRGRLPTSAEIIRVARGESPDSVFSGELDRYYPMSGPADLAPAVGTGDLALQSVGTDVGYTLRKGGTLSGASNGTSGFTVDMPLSGHVWALDLDDVAAGAPVSLSVTNTLGASTQFQARAVLYSDGTTTHTPWTQMTGGPVALDATATLELPEVTWSELLHIEVRRADATSVTWCSGPCGVGPDIIDDGQSQRNIWATNITTDATSLAAITISNPCVSISYPPRTADGVVYPLIHRLIDTAIDTPIGPAAFAKRFAEITGNKVARIRAQGVEGSGRDEYTSNNQLPKTVNTGPYRYWGTAGTEGSGIVADHLLKCGIRFSAIVGHYSADDLTPMVFADLANPYFFGTGDPSRHWGQVTNPIGLRVFLCEHDRIERVGGSATLDNFYTAIRNFVTANSASFSLAPAFTLDKRMEDSAQQAHQDANNLRGNARMAYRYAAWLAGLLGVEGGMANPGTLTSVTSETPFTSATCSFSIPSGASLAVSDGGTGVHGFEVNVAGGGWTRVTPANAQISSNTVVISNIVGASAASDIQVRYGYDHAWGTDPVAADRFIEDNALIEQVLLTTIPDAPTEPEWAKGMPLMPSNGAVTA